MKEDVSHLVQELNSLQAELTAKAKSQKDLGLQKSLLEAADTVKNLLQTLSLS